jgi:hypothetical protein
LATDTETAAAISSHNSATTSVHGITNTATLATQTYADSAVSTHAAISDPHSGYLKESEYNVAGKNLIINGGFDHWQRGTSLALSSSYAYLADRFNATVRNGAGTQSRHTLTAAESAICANLKYAYKFDVTTQATNTNPKFYQGIEDSWYYYGKTITVSFYAKASKNITLDAAADLIWANADNYTTVSSFSLTTTFQRFNYTFSLSPSGTYNSATDYLGLQILFQTPMNDTYTVYITGIQAEFGSTVTPFFRAGGDIQGELVKCQRYYYRETKPSTGSALIGPAYARTTGIAFATWTFPVTMRSTPTLSFSNATQDFNLSIAAGDATFNTLSGSSVASTTRASLRADAGSHTIGQAGVLGFNGANAWIEASAEL